MQKQEVVDITADFVVTCACLGDDEVQEYYAHDEHDDHPNNPEKDV